MKGNNYITGFGWMFNELGLKGNEAWVFALIHGFSQDGESKFTGSLTYICKTLNISRPTTIKILKELESKNLVYKHQTSQNNIVYNSYSVGSKETLLGSKETLQGSKETLRLGSKETLPNNTSINNTNYIPNGIEFLKNNFPSRFESDFLMNYRKLFKSEKQLSDFYQDFNDEVEAGAKVFDQRLFGFLKKYARNWTNFKNKDNQPQADSIIYSPSLRKIV